MEHLVVHILYISVFSVGEKVCCGKLPMALIVFDPFTHTTACNKYIIEQLLTTVRKDCSRYLLTVKQPTNYIHGYCPLFVVAVITGRPVRQHEIKHLFHHDLPA